MRDLLAVSPLDDLVAAFMTMRPLEWESGR
jgi:hypothetical protein